MKPARKAVRWIFFFSATMWLTTACLERPLTEASPITKNQFIALALQSAVTKIDLLFMIDNSASMSDKQEILRAAVPVLLTRLTSPFCVDPLTRAPTGENSLKGKCARGEPEFNPVPDIHVGVVTSSLGAHGGVLCSDKAVLTPNDQAHLLGTVRSAGGSVDPSLAFDVSRTWNHTGFLAWDANQIDQPRPGSADPASLKADFQDMIVAAGERGCGLEASLEAWYRFLVDPEPPKNVTTSLTLPTHTVRGSALVTHADGTTDCEGCDLEILAQRRAFLRPDSLLAIVMLSDENDCSIRDDGVGWFVAGALDQQNQLQRMPRATSACALNPNDPCCRSCVDASATPAGCLALAEDPECKKGQVWDAPNDSANLRCYHQKQRFGFDALYPIARYVEALTSPTLTLQSDGKTKVQNPLFAKGPSSVSRDKSEIFLAGIVGVPWQDIADEASLRGPGLKYLTAAELNAKDRWTVLLGQPDASPPLPPSDPFMIETPLARHGENPITHDPIVAANSQNPSESPINGHEQNLLSHLNDLQYACSFPLVQPKICQSGQPGCDCDPAAASEAGPTDANSPLCQPPAGGPAGSTQFFAKAYPGTRELQVLKELQDQGIVASICPKRIESPDPAQDPDYGYNPAVAAIIERLKTHLTGKCLPRAIESDPVTHQVECKVIEAQLTPTDCRSGGRGPADPVLNVAVQRELAAIGVCGAADEPMCSSFQQCEILQEEGTDLDACRQGQSSKPGFCYIDDPNSPWLMGCPSNEKRLLRFVSDPKAEQPTPARGAVAFIACLGAAL